VKQNTRVNAERREIQANEICVADDSIFRSQSSGWKTRAETIVRTPHIGTPAYLDRRCALSAV
jgi:hypothetical protein